MTTRDAATGEPSLVYGPSRRPDAPIPLPGLKLRKGRVAIVATDPQVDFLSPKGVAWPVVGKNVVENRTVENLGQLFAAAKSHDIPLFISPHYDFPHDHAWEFEGALERLMHDIHMFDRPAPLDPTELAGSGADWMEPYKRNLKHLEFRLLDTGHFALEEDGATIAALIRGFLAKQLSPTS